MNSYTLGVADLRKATGWGRHRARMIVLRPYPLRFHQDLSGPRGGGRKRRYWLSDLLARCRGQSSFTTDMELKLFAADAAIRKGTEK